MRPACSGWLSASPVKGALLEHRVFDPSQFWAVLDTLPIAVLVGRGRDCAEVDGNSAARMLLRSPPGQNLSRSAPESEKPGFEIFVAGRPVPASELPMQRAAATGKPVHRSECEVRFASGDRVFLSGHSVPLVDDEGTARGSIGAFVDITETKQLERQKQQLTRELQLLNAKLEQMSAAVGQAPGREPVSAEPYEADEIAAVLTARLGGTRAEQRLRESEERLRLAVEAAVRRRRTRRLQLINPAGAEMLPSIPFTFGVDP